jgi:hypothetical protein
MMLEDVVPLDATGAEEDCEFYTLEVFAPVRNAGARGVNCYSRYAQ